MLQRTMRKPDSGDPPPLRLPIRPRNRGVTSNYEELRSAMSDYEELRSILMEVCNYKEPRGIILQRDVIMKSVTHRRPLPPHLSPILAAYVAELAESYFSAP